ncbi:MAG: NAD(P)H-hydrate dehydratase, partial [Cyclobacteriaceae bacterium]|nr:NAD(P)H-hydrate dehydratase [Cyclobacteriaceae bacterium HetDA_MAG_MS6]
IELVSIDIASGLLTDGPWLSGNEAILQPSHTISFQLPKLAFFQPQLAPFVGQWHVVGIGLDSTFIGNCKTSYFLTEPRDIIQKVQMREKFMHKGDAGRLQLVVGSKGKMGAAVLATRAAIRAGVGLLTSQVPGCGVDILQISCPEAMVYTDDSKEYISSIQIGPGVTSVGIGPGLGTSKKTKGALSTFIQRWEGGPLVLDADALNILSEEPLLLSALPVGSILTPHPGEFQRLVGAWKDDQEKLEKLVGFCTKYQLNVVLKGAYSAVCDTKGQVFFNPTGNPGMATAGSGDVLLGLVSGLLVQGYLPDVALKLAVFLHGKAGDLAVQEKTTFGLIASDMIEAIPSAFRTLIS